MRVWSKGLGNMTLKIDFSASEVHWEDGTVTITGWIRDPVVWNYKITFEDRDLPGLLKIGMNRPVFRFVFRRLVSLFNSGQKEKEKVPSG